MPTLPRIYPPPLTPIAVEDTEPKVDCPAFDWNVPPIVTLPVVDAVARVVTPVAAKVPMVEELDLNSVEEATPDGASISKNLWPDPEATVRRFPVWLTRDWMRSVVEAVPADGDLMMAREVLVESVPMPAAFWRRSVEKRP